MGAGAERVWAEGLKIAPDLPQVYLHRGVYELDHGDLKPAEADLSTAAAKAPHYADPLKAWGDVLAKQGRWKDAPGQVRRSLEIRPRLDRPASGARRGGAEGLSGRIGETPPFTGVADAYFPPIRSNPKGSASPPGGRRPVSGPFGGRVRGA